MEIGTDVHCYWQRYKEGMEECHCHIKANYSTHTAKLLKKTAKEGGMGANMSIEFEGNYDDVELTFKDIICEFVNDT